MPYTGLKIAKLLSDFSFEVKNLSEPEINITYSGFYFAKLLRYFQKNLAVATAAYNAGPNVVNHWIDWCKGCSTPEFIESIPYRETRRYVREVMKTYAHYRRLYESHTTFPSMENLPKNRSDAADIF